VCGRIKNFTRFVDSWEYFKILKNSIISEHMIDMTMSIDLHYRIQAIGFYEIN